MLFLINTIKKVLQKLKNQILVILDNLGNLSKNKNQLLKDNNNLKLIKNLILMILEILAIIKINNNNNNNHNNNNNLLVLQIPHRILKNNSNSNNQLLL